MKWFVGLVVLVVIAVAAYFVFKPTMYAPTQTAQPAQQESGSSATMQEVSVSGTEFAFTPSTITVKKGQEVKLTFKNNGQYPHNFTVSELGVATNTVEPGGETTITFTPDKTGSFTYVCTVPGHADRGMKGTLTVE